MSKELIVWEKWVDPFGQFIEEAKWTDYDGAISDSLDEIDLLDYEEDDESTRDTHQIRVIASPMGLIPYNEFTAPGKIFNFWVAHTNFNITPTISKIIEESEGVEILDIFTRYRFRIGVGKCFSDSETMKHINDNVYQFLSTKNGK